MCIRNVCNLLYCAIDLGDKLFAKEQAYMAISQFKIPKQPRNKQFMNFISIYKINIKFRCSRGPSKF